MRGLASRARAEVRTGAVVVRLEGKEDVRLAYRLGSELHELQARHVILAVPTAVASSSPPLAARRSRGDAMEVVSLHCGRLPAARGVRTAWDSIQYGAEGLGYVTNVHQLGRYRGPAVLTWYEALAGEPPRAAARRLRGQSRAVGGPSALDTCAGHPDLLDCVEHVDVTSWGHGTARPAPGLHHEPVLQAPQARRLGLLCPTDLSGMSLFEEASWHGVERPKRPSRPWASREERLA